MAKESKLLLADALATISEELRKADARAKADGTPVMMFQECEVEFSVAMEKEGKAGVAFWVIEAGAGVKSTTGNKVKVKFVAIPDFKIFNIRDPELDKPAAG